MKSNRLPVAFWNVIIKQLWHFDGKRDHMILILLEPTNGNNLSYKSKIR